MLVLAICFLIFSCQNKRMAIVNLQNEVAEKLNHLRTIRDSCANLKIIAREKYDTNTIRMEVEADVQMLILQKKYDSLEIELNKF